MLFIIKYRYDGKKLGNEAIKCCFKGKLTVLSVYIIKSSPQIITLKRLFKKLKNNSNAKTKRVKGKSRNQRNRKVQNRIRN